MLNSGNHRAAVDFATKALAFDAENRFGLAAKALRRRGSALLKLGAYDEAINDFVGAISVGGADSATERALVEARAARDAYRRQSGAMWSKAFSSSTQAQDASSLSPAASGEMCVPRRRACLGAPSRRCVQAAYVGGVAACLDDGGAGDRRSCLRKWRSTPATEI